MDRDICHRSSPDVPATSCVRERRRTRRITNTSKDAECEKSARGMIVSIDITPNKIGKGFCY
jgi:hypothetical protein